MASRDWQKDSQFVRKYGVVEKVGSGARKCVQQGLRSCRSTYALCAKMGDIDWDAGDIQAAVKWWIRSATVQVLAQEYDSAQCFLYLAAIAEGLELRDADEQLIDFLFGIDYTLRLNTDKKSMLSSRARETGDGSMRRAIEELCALLSPTITETGARRRSQGKDYYIQRALGLGG